MAKLQNIYDYIKINAWIFIRHTPINPAWKGQKS